MTKIKVETLFNKDLIISRVGMYDESDPYSLLMSITDRVVALQEEGVRRALIELGWTPPKDGRETDADRQKDHAGAESPE